MAKVSIIIPARGEKFENLLRTIQSVQENATGEYEVIVGFDGGEGWTMETPPIQQFIDWKRNDYKEIHFPRVVGIKTNINAMAAMATGKYIYKSDAHCSFGKGFDEILQADMEDDWIVMPRFYVLNDETWEWQDKRHYDYFYLCCPFTDPKGFRFKAGGHWPERTAEREPYVTGLEPEDFLVNSLGRKLIDETPQIHGSGWFMTKDRYFELGGFPNIDPYGHAQEPIWLALKNWFEGGKVMVNKKTWYAHMHQDNNQRGYKMDKAQENKSYDIAARTFMKDPRMWKFLEKFMPMPTWPENWGALLFDYQRPRK